MTPPTRSRAVNFILEVPSNMSRQTRSSVKRSSAAGQDAVHEGSPSKRLKTSNKHEKEHESVLSSSKTDGRYRDIAPARSTSRSPTKIAAPAFGDVHGPSTSAPTRSRTTTRAGTAHLLDHEAERSMSRSGSSPRGAQTDVQVNTHLSSVNHARTAGRHVKEHTGSRKRAAMSDLMKIGSTPATLVDFSDFSEDDAPVPLHTPKKSTKHSGRNSSPTEHLRNSASARKVSPDASDSEDDTEMVSLPAKLNASPGSAFREDGENTEDRGLGAPTTPSKHRQKATSTPDRLQALNLSLKKKTPTKAVKSERSGPALSTTLQLSSVPPGDTRISSLDPHRPQQSQKDLYPRKDVVGLLDDVLYQLHRPRPVTTEDVPESGTKRDRHWLTTQESISPVHQVAEKDVRSTMHRTIREGEGNCLMLIGERGVGKTAIVDRSLDLMETLHGKDGFQVVRLSGLLQRDDKAALKEMARQLCTSAYIDDVETGEGTTSFTSNASILSSLLAILEPSVPEDAEGTTSKGKPLIFVIDEFDLFAHHSVRQSFLYCLLDCVQGGFRRAGMAVFGLSARADCIETLEKRVKSRCQSRVHNILPAEDVLAGAAAIVKKAMFVSDAEQRPLSSSWNAIVEALFSSRDAELLIGAMNDLRGLGADQKLFDIMTVLLARLRSRCAETEQEPIPLKLLALSPADMLPFLQWPERGVPGDLSIVEVAMLISAKHLVDEERPLNFTIAYTRYIEHCKRAAADGSSSARAFSRGLCLKAYERLRSLGLVRDAVSAGKTVLGGASVFRLCRLVPWSQMIDDAVKERKDIPQHLMKWCRNWSD